MGSAATCQKAAHKGGWIRGSIVLTDSLYAGRYSSQLLDAKRQAASFLPMLVLLPQSTDSTPWLKAGFDDVLRMPLTKAELAARLTVFLRLRQQSEARFRTVFENAPIGIYRSTPAGRLLVANPAIADLFGYDSFDAMSQVNLSEVAAMHDYQREQLRERLDREGEVVGFESPVRRHDGSTIFIRENARVIFDTAGTPLFYEGTIEDVTERKRAEQALQQREEHFRTLIENSADAIALVDLEGTILYASQSSTRMLGYSTEEMVGQNVLSIVHPDDLSHTIEQAARAVQTSELVHFEHRIRHKDGSWRWIEATDRNLIHNPAIGAIVVNFRDVTERRQAEEEKTKTLYKLGERVKELRLLRDASDLLHGHDYSLEETLARLAQLLPEGWQHRDVTVARISLNGTSYTSENFQESPWTQRAMFSSNHHETVTVEVAYLEQRWAEGEEPFTPEKWGLINSIAQMLHSYLEGHETEKQLRFQGYLLNEVGQAVVATNMDGAINYWNKAAEALYGWSAQEVAGQNILEVTPSTTTRAQAVAIMEALQQGESWSGEFEVQRRDGSSFPALVTDSPLHDEAGELIGIIGISTDISERKRSEEQLRFQAQLLDSVRESVIATDLTGTILYWGKGAELLYGYSAEEALGQPYTVFMGEEEATSGRARLREVLRKEQWHGQHLYQRRDGSTIWVDTLLSLVQDEAKQPRGIIGIDRDITQRKQREREMEAIAQVSQGMRSATTPGEMMPLLLYQVTSLLGADGAALAMLESKSGDLVVRERYGNALGETGQRIYRGTGRSAEIIQMQRPFLSDDMLHEKNLLWQPEGGLAPSRRLALPSSRTTACWGSCGSTARSPSPRRKARWSCRSAMWPPTPCSARNCTTPA